MELNAVPLDDALIDVPSEKASEDAARNEEDEMEHGLEIPPRPTSRLGFNGSGDFDEDAGDDDDEFGPAVQRPANSICDWTFGVFARDQSSPDMECDADISGADDSSDSDEEDADYEGNLLLFPPPPPSSRRQSSSQLPLPPPAPPPQEDMLVDEVAHPFSCLPSPLSPCYVNEAHPLRPKSPTLPRNDHRHHGRSHNALLHTKWFWSMREEEWQEYQGPEAQDVDVDKLSRSPTTRQSLPSLANNSSLKKTHKLKQATRFPPLSIHPRRGDISALRDPYCAHVDRCLAELPMWTIAKTLWMFDVQMGVERKRKAMGLRGDGDGDSGEESEDDGPSVRTRDARSLSTSSGFSDDSDVTLVESDADVDEDVEQGEDTTLEEITEVPREQEVEDSLILECAASSPSAGKGRCSPECLPRKPLSSPSLKLSPKSASKASLASHLSRPHFFSRPPYFSPNFASLAKHLGRRNKLQSEGWETDAYTRWDLLIDIVRLDRDSSSHPSSPRASCSRSRRFFFASECDDGDGLVDSPASSSELFQDF